MNISKKKRVVAYSISEYVENEIKHILLRILDDNNCTDLFAPIYTSVKELIINAVKANYKNIYFEGYAPKNKSFDVIDYEMALKLFKLELTKDNAKHLETIARKENMMVNIELWAEKKILHAYIKNPVKMTDVEEQNIQKKLIDAEKCEDVADYFLKVEHDPNREGAGLGLVLIIMMLKSLNAPNDSMMIFSDDDSTVAYLKIPLNSEISAKI